jgi:aryl-alcohol dehydrogenase-like predicted oxidoreductase
VLLGASTRSQLASNLAAERVPLAPAALEALRALQESAPAYWARRAALPWT